MEKRTTKPPATEPADTPPEKAPPGPKAKPRRARPFRRLARIAGFIVLAHAVFIPAIQLVNQPASRFLRDIGIAGQTDHCLPDFRPDQSTPGRARLSAAIEALEATSTGKNLVEEARRLNIGFCLEDAGRYGGSFNYRNALAVISAGAASQTADLVRTTEELVHAIQIVGSGQWGAELLAFHAHEGLRRMLRTEAAAKALVIAIAMERANLGDPALLNHLNLETRPGDYLHALHREFTRRGSHDVAASPDAMQTLFDSHWLHNNFLAIYADNAAGFYSDYRPVLSEQLSLIRLGGSVLGEIFADPSALDRKLARGAGPASFLAGYPEMHPVLYRGDVIFSQRFSVARMDVNSVAPGIGGLWRNEAEGRIFPYATAMMRDESPNWLADLETAYEALATRMQGRKDDGSVAWLRDVQQVMVLARVAAQNADIAVSTEAHRGYPEYDTETGKHRLVAARALQLATDLVQQGRLGPDLRAHYQGRIRYWIDVASGIKPGAARYRRDQAPEWLRQLDALAERLPGVEPVHMDDEVEIAHRKARRNPAVTAPLPKPGT